MGSLSAAYFVGEIQVPNISGSSTAETANLLQLQIAIAKYEPLFMDRLLGTDFYADYVAGIAAVIPETRWTTLRDKIYVLNGTLGVGFSPAANYVYFFFMRNQTSISLINSEVQAVHENFSQFGPGTKMVAAWNEMVRMIIDFRKWLTENIADYPECDLGTIGYFETLNTFGI